MYSPGSSRTRPATVGYFGPAVPACPGTKVERLPEAGRARQNEYLEHLPPAELPANGVSALQAHHEHRDADQQRGEDRRVTLLQCETR
jgi:hypothetical protein